MLALNRIFCLQFNFDSHKEIKLHMDKNLEYWKSELLKI